MSRDWEAQFRERAKPPGKTEQDRCDNAASAIRNAIKASDKLRERGVSVFVQGSYRNNTNVRKDSDVDILNPPPKIEFRRYYKWLYANFMHPLVKKKIL